jgi:hypothetical protein
MSLRILKRKGGELKLQLEQNQDDPIQELQVEMIRKWKREYNKHSLVSCIYNVNCKSVGLAQKTSPSKLTPSPDVPRRKVTVCGTATANC